MRHLIDFFFGREITRDQLGRIGGRPRFDEPAPDRAQETAQGTRPTAQSSAAYPWWYQL